MGSKLKRSWRLLGADGEGYWLTYVFAWALTLGLIVFGGAAWIAKGEYFQAFLCLMAQLLAISFAVLARRALDKEAGVAYVFANLAFMAGCCYWSELSLYNAWEASNSGVAISKSMAWFMAVLEPLLIWITEEIRFRKKAGEEFEADLPAYMPPVAEKPPEAPPRAFHVEPPRPSVEPEKAHPRPALTALQGGLNETDDAARRDLAKDLLSWGMRPVLVVAKTNIPPSTAKKWAHIVPVKYIPQGKPGFSDEQRRQSAQTMLEKGVPQGDIYQLTGVDLGDLRQKQVYAAGG